MLIAHVIIDLGSIAEREHQKWKNAEEIPNNPYSPEALQKRLNSQWSRDFDLERLVAKSNEETAAPHLDVPASSDESPVGVRKPDIARYFFLMRNKLIIP